MKVVSLIHICSFIVAILALATMTATQPLNMTTTPNTTKPGCPRQCGNLTVPYPFGIGPGSGCSLSPWYDIHCDISYDPPRAFSAAITAQFDPTMIEVLSISDSDIRVRNNFVAYACYNSTGGETITDPFSISPGISYPSSLSDTSPSPFRLSATSNRLTVVGCNDYASLSGSVTDDFAANQADSSCPANCSSPDQVVAGECNGIGCCQATIQSGLRYFSLDLNSGEGNHTNMASWDPCGYAFVGEQGSFSFRGAPDLKESSVSFMDRVRNEVPVVLDWVIGNQTCSQARQDPTTFLCQQPNTVCVEAADTVLGGYRCSCKQGYQGNPYHPSGCTDINECEGKNNCSMHCVNTVGSYKCFCPSGYSGDGRNDGTSCRRHFPKVPVALGASFGFLFLIIGLTGMSLMIKEKRLMRRRNEFFHQNGGFLLKQFLPSDGEESPNIFTIKDLMVATNNFSEGRIVGKGGYGTVYRGILPGNQIVAIKKSKVVDEFQIEQFINELVLLTRLNHENVVKLLGCCLETEVPLLVYEFISNGTLYDQIHAGGGATSWLSWSNCLRIAIEAAKALAYLHSMPIIHRDIKSTNILLDDNYRTKISDFGISRLIPMDKTRMATLVQGTLGYLDPEYFFSSELTNKSDVYSFGVVLAELLTRKAPLLDEKLTGERNLSVYFVKSMKAGRLFQIVDPGLLEEASQDQLIIVGKLILSCLSVRGDDRPTMNEVTEVLERLYVHVSGSQEGIHS